MSRWTKFIELIDRDVAGVQAFIPLCIVPLLVFFIPAAFLPLPWSWVPLGLGAVISAAGMGIWAWRWVIYLRAPDGAFRRQGGPWDKANLAAGEPFRRALRIGLPVWIVVAVVGVLLVSRLHLPERMQCKDSSMAHCKYGLLSAEFWKGR